jgi:hypothetical protein
MNSDTRRSDIGGEYDDVGRRRKQRKRKSSLREDEKRGELAQITGTK